MSKASKVVDVRYAVPEKQAIFDIFNSIANNQEIKMTQNEASVMSGILARTKTSPKTTDFERHHLESIKSVVSQTLDNINALPEEERKEYEEFGGVLQNVINKTNRALE